MSPEAMEAYFGRLAEMIADLDASAYLGPVEAPARLSTEELRTLTGAAVACGFHAPERSVDTRWIADRVAAALGAEPQVELRTGHRVEAVQADGDRWRVLCDGRRLGPFDAVVNALWEGRLAVDASVGLRPPAGWSHRFRQSLFVDTAEPLDLPNVVLATGPFGDVKAYGPRRFYLSWYEAGLAAEGGGLEPPEVRLPPPETVIAGVRRAVAEWLPPFERIFEAGGSIQVEGGWVFAQGRGSLSDPAASLHRRDRFGVLQRGGYISVDTGKYSSAPLLARQVAERILEG